MQRVQGGWKRGGCGDEEDTQHTARMVDDQQKVVGMFAS